MIFMDRAQLHSQQGMERAIRDYLGQVKTQSDGTFNGMLAASLHACDYAGRTLVLRVETKSWMENPNNVVHGGVSAALLDMTMGTLCRYFSGGGMTPTVSMSVNYLHPVPVDRAILIGAELPMAGFTLCHAAARLWAEGQEDTPLCTATGVYFTDRGGARHKTS